MRRATWLLLILLLAISGCGGGDSQIVGKWKGEAKLSKSQSDNPMAKAIEGLASLFTMNVEFKEDHKFNMTLVIFPIEGSWSRSGNTVTLVPEKVMGMTPDEFKANQSKSKTNGTMNKTPDQDPSKPMELEVQSDGTMILKDPAQKQNSDSMMVFTKQK